MRVTSKYFLLLALTGCVGASDAAPVGEISTKTESETKVTPVDVLKNVEIVYRYGSDTDGVANILCLSDEKLVGGGCGCTGDPDVSEGGYLAICGANDTTDGYVGGCYSFEVDQVSTPVTITLTCMKVTTQSVASAAPSLAGLNGSTEDKVEANAVRLLRSYNAFRKKQQLQK